MVAALKMYIKWKNAPFKVLLLVESNDPHRLRNTKTIRKNTLIKIKVSCRR